MAHQKFDSLAARLIKFMGMSAGPKDGLWADLFGNLKWNVNGVTIWGVIGGVVAQLLDGAIAPSVQATYVITKASAAALTLAAPVVTTDDGKMIRITSNTAFAHVLTATGLLQTGAAAANTATFANKAGASLLLMAYQGKWNVLSQNQITFA